MCAVPRANHVLRTVVVNQVKDYAAEHDQEYVYHSRADVYYEQIMSRLNNWVPGARRAGIILPPGASSDDYIAALRKDLDCLLFGSGWPQYEDKWKAQLPALRAWCRLLALPGGISAVNSVRFVQESGDGPGRARLSAREVDKRAAESLKIGLARRWFQKTDLPFRMLLKLAIVQLLEGFVDVLFEASPTGWYDRFTAGAEEPESKSERGRARRRRGIGLVCDEAEQLLVKLWGHLLGDPDVTNGEPLWEVPLAYRDADAAGFAWQTIGQTLYLVIGEVVLRWALRHGFAPYEYEFRIDWPRTMSAPVRTFASNSNTESEYE